MSKLEDALRRVLTHDIATDIYTIADQAVPTVVIQDTDGVRDIEFVY